MSNVVRLPIRRAAKMAEFRELTPAEINALSDKDLAVYVADLRKADAEKLNESPRPTQQEIDAVWGEDVPKPNSHDEAPPHDGEGQPGTKQRDKCAFVRKFKGGGAFIREYVPISYTLDGILPSGVLYFVTARRGTGKTAWLLAVILAVALDRQE